MPTSKSKFTGTYIQFSDLLYYDFEIDLSSLSSINYKQKNMDDIIKEIFVDNKKGELVKENNNFARNHMNVEVVANNLINNLESTYVKIEDIISNRTVKYHISKYNKYLKTNPGSKYSDFRDLIGIIYTTNRYHAIKVYANKGIKKIHDFGEICYHNSQHFMNRIIEKSYSIVDGPRFNLIYRRTINSQNPKTKMKERMKSNFIKSHNYYTIQKEYSSKLKRIQNINGPIKVAFIVIFDSVFPYRTILEIMLKDSDFDPYIIVAPPVSRSFKYQMDVSKKTFESYHNAYGERVLMGYDELSDSFLELKDEYPIVFFSNPYKNLVNGFHYIDYFLDKDVLTVYANYGYAVLKYWDEVISTDFYNKVWKICLETDSNLEYLKKKQLIKGLNGMVTGYFKADTFIKKSSNVISGKKMIIISPHHTVWGWKSLNISNFLKYYDFFVELPKIFPDIEFVFRPHPLLFSNLVAYKIWSQKQIDNYLTRLLSSPNITYDVSSDYSDLFSRSDAIIHDCGSFIGEYLFMKKPCCYMIKSLEKTMEGLVPLGQECMKVYYHAMSKEDILNFIEDVVINGNDPLKENRDTFVDNTLSVINPNASSNFVKYLKEQIGRQN